MKRLPTFSRWMCKQCGWLLGDRINMKAHIRTVHQEGIARKIIFREYDKLTVERNDRSILESEKGWTNRTRVIDAEPSEKP